MPTRFHCRYVFTADSLSARTVSLNGSPLVVEGGVIPPLTPHHVADSPFETIDVAPHSIGFHMLTGIDDSACA